MYWQKLTELRFRSRRDPIYLEHAVYYLDKSMYPWYTAVVVSNFYTIVMRTLAILTKKYALSINPSCWSQLYPWTFLTQAGFGCDQDIKNAADESSFTALILTIDIMTAMLRDEAYNTPYRVGKDGEEFGIFPVYVECTPPVFPEYQSHLDVRSTCSIKKCFAEAASTPMAQEALTGRINKLGFLEFVDRVLPDALNVKDADLLDGHRRFLNSLRDFLRCIEE